MRSQFRNPLALRYSEFEHGMPAPLLPLTNLQAVIFDLDGTLYDLRRLRIAMLGLFARKLGIRPIRLLDTLRTLRHYRLALEELRPQSQHCEDLQTSQLLLAARRCGQSTDTVRDCVQRWFIEQPQSILEKCRYPGLIETLDRMTAANLKLAVLSDYPADDKLQALGIRHYFKVVVSAQQVGFLKPNPTGLLHVLDLLDVRPEEALYVGDRFEVDAVTAQRAGVPCALLGCANDRPEGCFSLSSVTQLASLLPLSPRPSPNSTGI